MKKIRHPWSGAWRLIIIMLGVIILLTACGKEHANPSEGKPEITIMVPLHFPHPPHEDLVSKLEELTGTKLNFEWVPDGIYTDKMNTALTTSSLKKVTFVRYTDYIIMKNAIRSDAFWEIGPLLRHYPNLARLSDDILEQAAVDGKIFGLYTERPSSRQGVILRKDWLEKLGLQEPGTIDELYHIMNQFTTEDPNGNGLADTIGLTDRNDLVYGAFKTISSYFGAPNNWLASEHRLVPEFETQEYKAAMDFMRKLYSEKLINQDFAITSKQMQRDLLIRGVAGVYIGSMTDIQRLSEEAQKVNPQAKFTLVNRIEGPSGHRVWSIPNYNGLFLFSKKAIKTEDELKAVLDFFNRSMDQEVSDLLRYGFEGRHHTVQEGKIFLPQETYQLRATELNAFHSLMIADLSNPNLSGVEGHEPLTAWAEQLSADNESFIVRDPVVALESKTYDERGIELYKIITDATYNYILGHLDEQGFKAETEKWRRSGGAQIIAEYEAAYFKR